MDRIERKRRWMVRRRLEGWKIADIAEALQVSEKTVDRWCSVHKKQGWEGLRVKSKTPHSFYRTPQSTVNLVLKLRRERIGGHARLKAIYETMELSELLQLDTTLFTGSSSQPD